MHVSLNRELRGQVEAHAERAGVSVTALVRTIVAGYYGTDTRYAERVESTAPRGFCADTVDRGLRADLPPSPGSGG